MMADRSEASNFEENTEESQKNPDGNKHETQEKMKIHEGLIFFF